jgi:hypothetical protein
VRSCRPYKWTYCASQNTELTEQVAKLSEDIDQLTHSIHEHVTSRG